MKNGDALRVRKFPTDQECIGLIAVSDIVRWAVSADDEFKLGCVPEHDIVVFMGETQDLPHPDGPLTFGLCLTRLGVAWIAIEHLDPA